MSVNLFDYVKMYSMPLMLNAVSYNNAKRSVSGKEEFGDRGQGWLDDVESLSFYRPYFRTVTGHNHTMFVFDIDTEVTPETEMLLTSDELRELKIKTVLQEFNDKKWINNYLMYISGQGLYMVQMLDKVIDKRVFEPIVYGSDDSILQMCTKKGRHIEDIDCDGWHNKTQDLARQRLVNNFVVTIKIDKRMFNHMGRRLFRGVYSPYFKIIGRTFFCVPVQTNDAGLIDIDKTLYYSQRENFKDPQPIYIPRFKYVDKIKLEIDESHSQNLLKTDRSFDNRYKDLTYQINTPTVQEGLDNIGENMVEEILTLVSSDVKITPPCIKNMYEQKYDRFWSRVTLVRYLAHKGYTPDDIATFIRFRLNDAEDNKPENLHKLGKYVRIAYGEINNPDPVSSCSVLQQEGHQHFACSAVDRQVCPRTHPLQSYPIKLKIYNEDLEDDAGINKLLRVKNRDEKSQEEIINHEGYERIDKLVETIINSGENKEIIKTTRAGVTTSLINQTAIQNKKMLVVSPTNAIGEQTFPNAMRIAKQKFGLDVTGAILSSNTKGCLKLRFKIKDLEHKKREEPEWGDEGVKYKNLAFHFKPSCVAEKRRSNGTVEYVECEYYQNRFPQPFQTDEGIPLPIVMSEITQYDPDLAIREGMCAYTSVVNDLDYYDILFITYDKLNTILINTNSDDAELVRNTLLEKYDVIFMDEVSQLAQQSPLTFDVFTKWKENGKINNSYLDKLYEDFDLLLTKYPTETAHILGEIIDTFHDYFKPIFDDMFVLNDLPQETFSIRYTNPLNNMQRLQFEEFFTAFYSMIDNYANEDNIHLSVLEKTLILLSSEYWWLTNVPTNDKEVNVSFVSSPKIVNIRNFVRDFNSLPNKQVLVTDATMPLVSMSDLFRIPFKRFVVGDPRRTCEFQLVVSDTKRMNSRNLISGEHSRYFNRLIKFINEVCKYHNPGDVMLVLPNSGTIYRNVKKLITKKKIPKDLQLTYYRSDITVGVSSDRRVMIAVCPPYPPKGSYLWLAQYYHEWGLFKELSLEELSERLETMNAYQTFYQTIGRVKSPDNSTRSIVYAWGIDAVTTDTLMSMDVDVPLPYHTTIEHKGADLKYLSVIGMFWREHGLIVDPDIIRLLNYMRNKPERKFRPEKLISNIFKRMNKDKRLNLQNKLMSFDTKVLEKFGIYSVNKNGIVYIYAI